MVHARLLFPDSSAPLAHTTVPITRQRCLSGPISSPIPSAIAAPLRMSLPLPITELARLRAELSRPACNHARHNTLAAFQAIELHWRQGCGCGCALSTAILIRVRGANSLKFLAAYLTRPTALLVPFLEFASHRAGALFAVGDKVFAANWARNRVLVRNRVGDTPSVIAAGSAEFHSAMPGTTCNLYAASLAGKSLHSSPQSFLTMIQIAGARAEITVLGWLALKLNAAIRAGSNTPQLASLNHAIIIAFSA
jgi:hypothetical protein